MDGIVSKKKTNRIDLPKKGLPVNLNLTLAIGVAAAGLAVSACQPAHAQDAGWRVGVAGGVNDAHGDTLNLNVSRDAGSFLTLEGDYDRTFAQVKSLNALHQAITQDRQADALSANVLIRPFGGDRLRPYAIGGLGYQWAKGGNEPTWTVGAGARYQLTHNLDLDARWRRVDGFDTHKPTNAFTFGFGLRF